MEAKYKEDLKLREEANKAMEEKYKEEGDALKKKSQDLANKLEIVERQNLAREEESRSLKELLKVKEGSLKEMEKSLRDAQVLKPDYIINLYLMNSTPCSSPIYCCVDVISEATGGGEAFLCKRVRE